MGLLSTILLVVGSFLLLGLLLTISAMKKLEPSQVLLKSSFWDKQYQVCTVSAFVFPFIHQTKLFDLKTKEIVIERVEQESLRCKDGVRVEIKIVFKVGVNNTNNDLLWVAEKLGCKETFKNKSVENYLKSGLLTALKSVIQSIEIEKINDNDDQIKEDILKRLAPNGELVEKTQEVIFNGYRIGEVSIEQLRQLPLDAHDPKNTEDSKGIRKIEKLSKVQEKELAIEKLKIADELKNKEHEFGLEDKKREDKRKNQKHEFDLEDKTKEDERKKKEHEIDLENKRRDEARKQEEDRLAEERKKTELEIYLENKRREENRQQEEYNLSQKGYERELALKEWEHQEELKEKAREQERQEAENQDRLKDKEREEEIRKIEHQLNIEKEKRELELAEEKQKTMELSTEVAQQEEEKNKAVVKAKNATEIQEAEGKKEIEGIKSAIEAQQQLSSIKAEVEGESYRIREVAKAKREAAEENGTAAEQDAQALTKTGLAEANVMKAQVEAENAISQQRINAQIVQEFIPVLPQIVERLMSPVDKIDGIKFININGMEGLTPAQPISGGEIPQTANTPFNSLLNVIMNVGVFLPVMKEVVATLKQDNNHKDILELVKEVPGGKAFLDFIERSEGLSHTKTKPEVIQDDYPE